MTRYNPNVYEQQILAKGRDLPTAPAPKQQFPKTIEIGRASCRERV